MASFIKQLINHKKDNVYPITKASAVYLNDVDTVERILNDLMDQNTKVEFPIDGSMIKTLASGTVITSKFDKNRIEEVTKSANGRILSEKITTFSEDGTINVNITKKGI